MFGISTLLGSLSNATWQKLPGVLEVRRLAVDPVEPSLIYIGAKEGVFVLDKNKGRVSQVFQADELTDVFVTQTDDPEIYVASDDGVYTRYLERSDWSRIYRGAAGDQERIYAVAVLKDDVYVGTSKGLFRQQFGQSNWVRVKKDNALEPIVQLEVHDEQLYIVSPYHFYRLESQTQMVSRLFSIGFAESSDDGQNSIDMFGELDKRSIRAAAFSNRFKNFILLATERGVYFSLNQGDDWKPFPQQFFMSDESSAMFIVDNDVCEKDAISIQCMRIFAGTSKGVFIYDQGQWHAVYKGMEAAEVYDFVLSEDHKLIVATHAGVFVMQLDQAQTADERSVMTKNFDHEPSVQEVHAMAIAYADVHPEKIENWKRLANKRAWFPDFDLGLDGGRSRSSSDSLWGTSSSGGTHYQGPDDKSNGHDLGWDVSLSWDFADVIWSTDQTTIDSRAKLMVELREDILDQITRLYFERRRLQMNVANNTFFPDQNPLEQGLRIEELTALIDALTGGEFSVTCHSRDIGKP